MAMSPMNTPEIIEALTPIVEVFSRPVSSKRLVTFI